MSIMTEHGKNNDSEYRANIERFTGFAFTYDKYRPKPPSIIIDILTKLSNADRPDLVVDLGCGTGLSTRIWKDRAEKVIGIEPSDDMRNFAMDNRSARNITYYAGFSHGTGLPDRCADIVTCSQSLHWMEPNATFKEIARILRPGGVFAAYDCDWPPVMFNREAEAAISEFMQRFRDLGKESGAYDDLKRWWKTEHLDRMRESGLFSFTKEMLLHHSEEGNAERLIGYIHALGGFKALLKHGTTEGEIGFEEFRDRINELLGTELKPWHFSYRMRVGIV